MAWIKSHTVVSRHRKLMDLADALKIETPLAVGHLILLWHSALEQQEDGDLSKWSDKFIAKMSMFQGDAEVYVKALQKYGWLDGRLIHDWIDHAGQYLTSKYKSSNKDALAAIWRRHGRDYGSPIGSEKEVVRNKEGSADKTDKTDKTEEMRQTASRKVDTISNGFEAFRSLWPKDEGMLEASQIWAHLKPDNKLQATILRAVRVHHAAKGWDRPDKAQFIPSAAKWLRNERWKDKVEDPTEVKDGSVL